jgi:RHS repeat-associated protein
VAELDAGGAVITRFVYGARAVAPEYMVRGGATYRLVTDQLGSVRLVIDTASGAIAQRIDHDAWGQVIADSNPGFQPFGYAGGLFDSFTALVRFGLRDYDPASGRWLSKDPIGFDGGDANLFGYAHKDPINWVDEGGSLAVAATTGALIGAISGFSGSAITGGSLQQKLAATVVGAAAGFAVGLLDPTEGALTLSAFAANGGLELRRRILREPDWSKAYWH